MNPETPQQEIIILGGGYAGVMCANRTVGDQVSSTLVSPIEDFVERVRPHEPAARTGRPGAWSDEPNNRHARSILSGERRRASTYRWCEPRSNPGEDRR